MVTRQIELTDEQARVLEEKAMAEGLSVAEVIQSRLSDLFEPQPPRHTSAERAALKSRALAAIGRFQGEATDLAREHDRYLEEAFSD